MNNIQNLKESIEQIVATNRNDLYNSHLYWSQKPYNVCDLLIENLTDEGDIIFDPFMGSGVTVIESVNKKYNRKVVATEINDMPIFIVNTLLKKYNTYDIERKIEEFVLKIKKLYIYYETNCILCNNKAIIEKCIFDRESWKKESVLKEIKYKCDCSKKTISKIPSECDKLNFEKNTKLEKIGEFEFIENSRLAAYKGEEIKHIFTRRNIKVIDEILIEIDKLNCEETKQALKYIVMSMLHMVKITDLKSNSQWPLWTPKKECVEKNVINVFRKRCNDFIKAIKYCQNNLVDSRKASSNFNELNDGNYLIINKPIQNIKDDDIPDEMIDLIITDPPYLGQVLYSEYMQLYQPFLEFKFNIDDEIVVSTSPERNKDKEVYYELMKEAFIVIGKKLKENKYMCMYFHDSNLEVWDKLINIMNEAKLQYISQVHISKSKNTLKNILSPKKSLNGDALLFFKKNSNMLNICEEEFSENEIYIMENKIIEIAKEIIQKKGYASTPQLYDNGILEYIINNNYLKTLSNKYKDLTDIFEKYLRWDNENGVWKVD